MHEVDVYHTHQPSTSLNSAPFLHPHLDSRVQGDAVLRLVQRGLDPPLGGRQVGHGAELLRVGLHHLEQLAAQPLNLGIERGQLLLVGLWWVGESGMMDEETSMWM